MDANCPNPEQQQQQQSKGGSLAGAVLGFMARGVAFAIAISSVAWQLVMKDGTVAAMGREAVKDVRSTLFQVAFGHGEQHGEPGAPLNPTQGEVASDRKGSVYGSESFPIHRSPSEIIDGRGGVHGQDAGRNGNVMTQDGPKPGQGWTDWLEEQNRKRNEGNADEGYGRNRERSLPDEQRDKQQEQERDHGHSQ